MKWGVALRPSYFNNTKFYCKQKQDSRLEMCVPYFPSFPHIFLIWEKLIQKKPEQMFKTSICIKRIQGVNMHLHMSHVHVLFYGFKFNGEIDIVQFIFTRCVVHSFIWYFFFLVSFNYKKSKEDNGLNHELRTNNEPFCKLHIVQLRVVQKYMDPWCCGTRIFFFGAIRQNLEKYIFLKRTK